MKTVVFSRGRRHPAQGTFRSIDAYAGIDRREAGWIKVELKPKAA